MFRLNMSDVMRGLVTAVVAGCVFAIAGVFQQPGFDLFSADWGAILSMAINAGFAALVGYLGKNFLSKNGSFMGRIR